MNANKIAVDALGTVGIQLLLVEVKEYFAYVDGKKSSTLLGHTYVVASTKLGLEKIAVKIPGQKLMDSPANFVEVEFNDLEMGVYVSNNQLNLTAKATGISLVSKGK